MENVLALERRYRGIWMALVVGLAFYGAEVGVRVSWQGVRLRDTLLSFEDNYLRWLVLVLVVVLGVVINQRNREVALTRQILETLDTEIAHPLAIMYTQLELLSIRAPGLRPEDLEKLAAVQKAAVRISALVTELAQGQPASPNGAASASARAAVS